MSRLERVMALSARLEQLAAQRDRVERLGALRDLLGDAWHRAFTAGDFDESERQLIRVRAVSAEIADAVSDMR